MAVTHADLEIRRPSRKLGGKVGTAVIALCAFCGLLGFVFSVFAESSKTKANWVMVTGNGGKEKFECVYSANGGIALLCAAGGFLTLAIAMIVQHAYMWIATISDDHRGGPSIQLTVWDVDSSTSMYAKQAAILFLTAWVCFGIAEVLLVIGIAVESTHLREWRSARNRCLVVRQGSFLAAGFFDLSTVFLATAFYFVVLQMKKVRDGEAAVQREVVEAALFSTPTSNTSNTMTSPSPNSAVEVAGDIQVSPVRDRIQISVKASNSHLL